MYKYRGTMLVRRSEESPVAVRLAMLSMVFACLVVAAAFLFCIRDCCKPRGFPPGPVWLPIVGCLPIFQWLRAKYGYVHLAFEKLTETHGPIVGVKLGQQKFVVVSSHELVRKALLREEFNGRPDGFFFRVRAFGDRKGVLFTEGPEWSSNRRLTMKHLRTFGFGQPSMQEDIAIEARDLVKNLRKKSIGGEPVAMHSAFDVAVLNMIWSMLAGYRFSYDDPELEKILPIVHDAFRITDTLGGIVSQIQFLRHIFPELSGYNDLMSVLGKLWAFVGAELNDHEEKMRSEQQQPRHLIDAYVLDMINCEKDPSARSFDRKDVIVLCTDLFLAGSKTTTDALAVIFAILAHHPEWQEIVHDDLDRVVGKYRDPILEDATLMPRVEAFLAEAQRTLIVTPLGLPHRATKSVSFEGYEIPKDTVVMVNFHSAHNDKSLWDRPDEFLPERFLDENGQFDRKNNFMQFGLGKRRCLGETLARSSLFLFFTHVVHNFDIRISEKHGPPSLDGTDGFVISPKPYYLELTPRFVRV